MIAVGTQRRDVLLQFLTGALTLAVGGGLARIVLGFGLATLIPRLVASLAGYPELPSLAAVGMSLGLSLEMDVLSGLYPAAQAAWMDPVKALRAE